MHRSAAVAAVVLALTAAALPAAASVRPELAPLHRAPGEAVDGSYIVVMEPGRSAVAAAERAGVSPTHVYRHALDGFAARLNAAQLEAVRRNPNVAWLEEDQVVTLAGESVGDTADARVQADRRDGLGPRRAAARRDATGDATGDVRVAWTQYPAPWHLDRIDQRFPPPDWSYTYNTTAPNADIYIIDTGIDPFHPEFENRVLRGYDAFGGNSRDCNGHGTSVAGVAAGEESGAAKDAWLWSVRVLDCNGSGTYSGVIAGTDWVVSNAASWPDFPAVANYSFAAPASSSLDYAVDNLSSSGVFVAVEAGNQGDDACNNSPARVASTFTAMASDRLDRHAGFSNHGPCTDGHAPGVDIDTTWLGGGHIHVAGTDYASALVAGVGAMYKATFGDAPSHVVKQWIVDTATPGIVTGVPPDTPNRLLYKADL